MGKIEPEWDDGILFLRLIGEFVTPEDQREIDESISQAIKNQPDGLVLDYGPVTRMTSGNYGVFLQSAVIAHNRAKEIGLSVHLLIPDTPPLANFMEHLKVTRLDTITSAFRTRQEAVDAFRQT